MRVLKGLFNFLILFIILGGLFDHFHDYLPFFAPVPCEKPIAYKLGAFDEKFEITPEEFVKAIAEAEAVWEKPSGKDLFAYAPEDKSGRALEINLVYDYRQEASGKLADLGVRVEETQASYDSLKAKYVAKKAEYEKAKKNFEVRLAAFDARKAEYDKSVDEWNAKGGAPAPEYNRLEAERVELEKEAKALETEQARVNRLVGEVNAFVAALNRLAGSLNLSVDRYNAVNETRGETFEEGVYQSDGFKRSINIYEFGNRAKLIRVLAHELGHALDLDHVPDAKSIMYEYNQSDSLTLSEADKDELALKCQPK